MPKQFLRKAKVAVRYDVNERTVDRMAHEDGRLPPPIYRGRIPLWDADELDKADRAAMLRSRKPRQPNHSKESNDAA